MNEPENNQHTIGTTLPEILTADDLALLLRVDRKTIYEAARAITTTTPFKRRLCLKVSGVGFCELWLSDW